MSHCYRDLKPSNIGLCGQGRVKVFDLGLSVVRPALGPTTATYEVRKGGGKYGIEKPFGSDLVLVWFLFGSGKEEGGGTRGSRTSVISS